MLFFKLYVIKIGNKINEFIMYCVINIVKNLVEIICVGFNGNGNNILMLLL